MWFCSKAAPSKETGRAKELQHELINVHPHMI